MELKQVYVKSVKADLAKREITISFILDMSEENMYLTSDLADRFTGKDSPSVNLDIQERPLPLFASLDSDKADNVKIEVKTFDNIWEPESPEPELPDAEAGKEDEESEADDAG